jgi:hypothetical protein
MLCVELFRPSEEFHLSEAHPSHWYQPRTTIKELIEKSERDASRRVTVSGKGPSTASIAIKKEFLSGDSPDANINK